ncbi:M16 family metallopeptidase [Sphingomonas colocasiae]|uniref:Insulinase family protein n=1 Tax=Sphingomonas colocasiae TaxID=1848973 RepID=A0ABS7PPN1_9SPHN|nr:insulinase family protein [Sphingomonas colocasiae]MBY8823228.1 insulinase family protein [Sphingomonas colocasiae]
MRLKFLLPISCSLMIVGLHGAAVAKAVVQPVSANEIKLDPEIRHGKLANGFTYYIRRNVRPAKRVEMRLVVKAGTMQQDRDQVEYAHLVEHIVANHVAGDLGTIWEWVQGWGGKIGTDFNAETSDDRTIYRLSLPSDQPELFAQALGIQRGWAQGAVLSVKDTARERKAVLAEILGSRNRQSRIMDQVAPEITSYYDTWDERQASIQRSDDAPVLRYYRDWYRPDTQAIIIVGDIDPMAVEAMVRKTFGNLPRGVGKRSPTVRPAPIPVRDRFRIITDPEQKEVQLRQIIASRGAEATGYQGLRSEIVTQLLERMYVDRELRLRDTFDPVQARSAQDTDVTSFSGRYSGGVRTTQSHFTLHPDRMREGVDAGLAVRRAVQVEGFQQVELDRARQLLGRDLLSEQLPLEERPLTSGSMVLAITDHFVKASPFQSWGDYERTHRQILASITLADINKAAREAWKGTNRELLLLAPPKLLASMPSEAIIRAWMNEAEQRPAVAYVPRVSADTLKTNVELPAYAGNLLVTRFEELGLTRVVIPENGVTIILKPDRDLSKRDIRGGQIHIAATRPMGAEAWSGNAYLNARQAGNLAYLGGVGGLSPFDYARLRIERGIWTSPGVDELETQYLAGAPRKELDMLMQLTHAHFTQVQRSEDAFRLNSRQLRDHFNKLGEKSPQKILADRVWEVSSRHSADRPKLDASNFDTLDYDMALGYYQQMMGNAGQFLFVVQGRFDPADITPTLVKYLSKLPSSGPAEIFGRKRPFQLRHDAVKETVYAGGDENASVILKIAGPVAVRREDEKKTRAFNNIMRARLHDRLREKENGTYSVQFGASMSRSAGEFSVSVSFDCKAVDVDRMVAAAIDELRKLRENGPTAAEVAKAMQLDATYLATLDDDIYFWPGRLSTRYVEESGADSAFEPVQYDQVTIESIKALAEKLIDPTKIQQYVRLPEAMRK